MIFQKNKSMLVTRLKNVIKEFNISLQRAVEFLSQNNINVTPDPNVKIESHIYEIFSKEFEKDKVIRKEVEKKISYSQYEKNKISLEGGNNNNNNNNSKEENNIITNSSIIFNKEYNSKNILDDKNKL